MKIKNLLIACSIFMGINAFSVLSTDPMVSRVSASPINTGTIKYHHLTPNLVGVNSVVARDMNVVSDFGYCTAARCYDLRNFANNPVTFPYFASPRYMSGLVNSVVNNGQWPAYCFITTAARSYNICSYAPAFMTNYVPTF